jgi:hypothetical protein
MYRRVHVARVKRIVHGRYGNATAFVAEMTISFILMITVLFASNRERVARYTLYFAGALIAI